MAMPLLRKHGNVRPDAGVLYLERVDFSPISNVRGELVYTLPLTPGEKATVSHKEWSHTSEEYIKEVEEELEKQVEKEVSESTELTESSKSEKEVTHKVATEVNVGAKFGSWTLEAKVGYDFESCKTNAVEKAIERRNQLCLHPRPQSGATRNPWRAH
jgi:hypothetical protein